MFKGFTDSYTGSDASGEIFFMLLVAFVLGWLLRWAYEKLMFEDYIEDEHVHDQHVSAVNTAPAPAVVAPVAPVAPEVESVPAPVQHVQPMAAPYALNDLKIVEGIGPKIESLLQDGGIDTWEKLAHTDSEDIKALLRAAGERYRIHDPSTWPEQAQLAHEGKWGELTEFQDALSGGKDLTKIYK